MRDCLSRLRGEGAGLVSPETLHAFGILTDAQLLFFEAFPLERWLLGEDMLDDVQQTVWSPTDALPYLGVLEGEEAARLLGRTVHLVVSRWQLETRLLALAEEEDLAGVQALRRLQETITARMTAPDTRPDAMQAALGPALGWQELADLPEPQRWQVYR